jgi:hypothetical protein
MLRDYFVNVSSECYVAFLSLPVISYVNNNFIRQQLSTLVECLTFAYTRMSIGFT